MGNRLGSFHRYLLGESSMPEPGRVLYKMLAVVRKAVQNTTAAKFTGDQESYTPAKHIESPREVMGTIYAVPPWKKNRNTPHP